MSDYLLIGPASPYRGGIANFNEALAGAFVKSGCKARILNFKVQYPSFLFPGKSQYDCTGHPSPVETDRMISSVNPASWYRSAAHISEISPDCIVVHYWMPFFSPAFGKTVRLAAKKCNAVVIGLIHNVNPHDRFPFAVPLTRYFLSSCNGFVVMSGSVKKDIEKLGVKRPAAIIPHPVYDIFGKPVSKKESAGFLGLEEGGRYILFFGIIRRYKGLDLLLQAMADKRVEDLDVKLIVAGEFYEDERYYRDLTKKLNITGRVLFTKRFIPSEHVKYYFSMADMVVQPYRSATQSGVTQIAYQFGRPMLVTRVGGLDEIVSHGISGYVTDPEPTQIAASIHDFYVNSREKTFSKNVEQERSRFTWEAMVNGINRLSGEIRKISGK